jgi:hypothetical protein
VCDVCDENTYDVDSDYIGSGTNHLQCELKLELEEMKLLKDSAVDGQNAMMKKQKEDIIS